jgi:hypothetical protein
VLVLIALVQSYVRPVTFILSKPSRNFSSYPFGLPRSEHKFIAARLFNIKDGRELRQCSSHYKNFSQILHRCNLDENLVVGLPLKVFKGQGWNSSRKCRISRKRLVHLEACCPLDIPNDFRITVSIRLGPVEMYDVDKRYVDDE